MNWWHRNLPALGGLFVGGLIGDKLVERPGMMSWGPVAICAIVWVCLDFYWNVYPNEEE